VIRKIKRKKGEITFIKILLFIKRIANLNSLRLITVLFFLIILKNHVNHRSIGSLLPVQGRVMQQQGYLF